MSSHFCANSGVEVQVSEAWLKEWVALPESRALAERLTRSGLEVAATGAAGPVLDRQRVVVGVIDKITPHPNADKLVLCTVGVGTGRSRQIVCGAPNVALGMKTVVAMHGARLPEMLVANREIRGVKSQGMLCSSRELGLDDNADGIIELDPDAPPGIGVSDYLDLQDPVHELELTPNRGDCLGVRGVAREIAVVTRGRLRIPQYARIKPVNRLQLPLELAAPEACPRYVGRVIAGIDMQARTPDWMVERLRRSGHRSINPIVDITNYVMHALGQPMHAFDLDTLAGGIRVRWAKPGESLYLLDGSTVTLERENLVIADHKKAVALGGIMGGGHTAISTRTSSVFLEAAFFAPQPIQGRARALGLNTDASHRFERGVDFNLPPLAIEYATRLIMAITGGEPGPVTVANDRKNLPRRAWISLPNAEIARVLGTPLKSAMVTRILRALGMEVQKQAGGWQVKPPSWRFDITAPHDLVEELGRCYGFENIAPRMPVVVARPGRHPERRLEPHAIKTLLTGRGYCEAITYSFVAAGLQQQLLQRDDAVLLTNPIADNMNAMRQSLWPGLLEALKTNLNRQENRVRLFEMGHVFAPAGNKRKSRETHQLGGVICGTRLPRQWGQAAEAVDFFDLKADVEAVLRLTASAECYRFVKSPHPALHPGQSAQIFAGRAPVGFIGQLNPVHQRALELEPAVFLFEIALDSVAERALPRFNEVSKFPFVNRDLAVVVDETIEVDKVESLIRAGAGNLLVGLELFDIYRGRRVKKNEKSLAFSLTFQAKSSNLTSQAIDALLTEIIGALQAELAARLRD